MEPHPYEKYLQNQYILYNNVINTRISEKIFIQQNQITT